METSISLDDFIGKLQEFKGDSEKKWMLPAGDHEADLMIIMSYPSVDMLTDDDLLAGGNGIELSTALELAGFKESDYYLTTMVKYGIGSAAKPSTAQINECAAMLDYEISVVQPKLILTLGAEPFKRIMKANGKVTNFLGNIITSPYGPILPNYSPGMIVTQDPKKRPEFREVFDLAKKHLDGTLNYTPFEKIIVDDPAINAEIIKTYIDEGKLIVGYDGEWSVTGRLETEVMHTFQYSCEPHKAIVLDISKDGLTENRELLDTMKPLLEHPNVQRMGWSIRADDKRLISRGIKPLEETLAFDGVKACGFMDNRWGKGLETGIKYFTPYRPYYKDLYEALKKHKVEPKDLCKLKFLEPDIFWDYCAGDAVAHRTACIAMKERIEKLPPKQKEYWYNTYLPLTNYFIDLEMNGIPIDLEVMEDITKKYSDKYNELKAALLEKVSPYIPEYNPNSQPDKKMLLFTHLGLTPAFYTKSGKSAKSRAWYEKQKPQTKKLYSPSTNGKTLATLAFDLAKELKVSPNDKGLQLKHDIVKNMLDLARVGVFATKFLSKQGTDFVDVEEGAEEEDEDPKKTSYWAAVADDHKIHPDFYEMLNNFRSSSKPNVQNPASKVLSHIPDIFVPGYKGMTKEQQKANADKIPRNLRHIFYSGHPDWYWTEVDVAGADLAIAAFCSGDKEYIKDILKGNFHLTKAREYFQDPKISKDDYSKYVSAKAITFRVAYTAELLSAAMPIQAEIYAESGIYVELDRIEYALKTWEKYTEYMAFRNRCTEQVDNFKYIENLKGIKYYFEDSEDFRILAGWKNESLAYPIASELALFLWDVSVSMKNKLKKDGLWMKWVYPVNSVHDASYWTIHKDLLKDNYFPELCKYYFTKACKITTGDNLGMEMVVADRWKGKEVAFHGETKWNFDKKCWEWSK